MGAKEGGGGHMSSARVKKVLEFFEAFIHSCQITGGKSARSFSRTVVYKYPASKKANLLHVLESSKTARPVLLPPGCISYSDKM